MNQNLRIRWLYLAVGTVAMLFAGIIYAWSILKIPFAGFGWSAGDLSLNFTITMSFFCIGGLLGARLSKAIGHKPAIVCAGVLSAASFVLTSLLSDGQLALLYLTYGVVAGLGIGIAYNVILSVVNPWFPDKKGLCSGFLMMGFGASALVLGNLAGSLFESSLGWRKTYILLGAALGAVLVISAFLLRKPAADAALPAPKAKAGQQGEDFSPKQMLSRKSFYFAFFYLVLFSAVGSSAISFARDLALDVGASAAAATTLVGVLSVCNGLGRILTGLSFDMLGNRKTLFLAAILTIAAAGVTLAAVLMSNLALGVAGLCLTGLSYGASPTTASTFTLNFYGSKYYATNMAIMVCSAMGSSLVATLCGNLLVSSGGFVVPFVVLLAMAVAALVLCGFIKKP